MSEREREGAEPTDDGRECASSRASARVKVVRFASAGGSQDAATKESGAKPEEAVSVSEREGEANASEIPNTVTERKTKLTRTATSSDTSTVGKSITVVHGSGKTCQIMPSELLDIIHETADRPRFANVWNRPCPHCKVVFKTWESGGTLYQYCGELEGGIRILSELNAEYTDSEDEHAEPEDPYVARAERLGGP
jgi:hypothetical protein